MSKQYTIKLTKQKFIEALNNYLKLKKHRMISEGTKKNIFILYPNLFLTSVLGDMQFYISFKIVDDSKFSYVKISLCPSILFSAIIFIIVSVITLLKDFKWYSQIIIFIILCFYLVDFIKCIFLYREMKAFISVYEEK